MHKPLYSKRIKKEYKLYALGAVIILLAIAVAILAWADGNLRITFIFGAAAVAQSFGILKVRSTFRRREANTIHHEAESTPRLRRVSILCRIFTLLLLVYGLIILARVLVGDYPMYVTLEAVLLIVYGGGNFLFIPLLIGE